MCNCVTKIGGNYVRRSIFTLTPSGPISSTPMHIPILNDRVRGSGCTEYSVTYLCTAYSFPMPSNCPCREPANGAMLSKTNIANVPILAIVTITRLCLSARESFAAELPLSHDARSLLDAPSPVIGTDIQKLSTAGVGAHETIGPEVRSYYFMPQSAQQPSRGSNTLTVGETSEAYIPCSSAAPRTTKIEVLCLYVISIGRFPPTW